MSLALSLNNPLRREPRWYRGDLHAHTNYSDGLLAPPRLVDVARAAGLDFFAITDHNSIGAYPHFGAPDDVLILPGLEATMRDGHFNIFGIVERTRWLDDICTDTLHARLGEDSGAVSELMRQTAAAGLLNSINHPLLPPWAWLFAGTDLRHVHCLEIWNDPSWPDNARGNPAAVALWTSWLNAGYRITAVGGSDFHRPAPLPGQDKPAERLGFPSTYVYAQELSGKAILAALRARRAYVSMGAQVSFRARAGDRGADIGEDLGPVSGAITFDATVTTPTAAVARILKNGTPLNEQAIPAGTPASLTARDTTAPDQPAWYRLDAAGEAGQMLAITNPIFAGPRPIPRRHRFGDFVPPP